MNIKIAISILFFLFSLFFTSLPCSFLQAESVKEYPIISPRYEAGMFSHFLTNLGVLECYERGIYQGCKVDFEKRGFYYDSALGSNWWEYYFNPLVVGTAKNSIMKKYVWEDCARLAYWAIDQLSRQRAYDLIQKYVRVKPYLLKEINEFIYHHFKAKHIIGVHYRGTDKITSGEAKFVSYETILQTIVDYLNKHQYTDYQIFVATDELNFLEYMIKSFPDRIIYQDAIRSINNEAVHVQKSHPFQLGKEALFDAILLSRCNYLIRTESNLSLCSTYFNPNIPVKVLYGKK